MTDVELNELRFFLLILAWAEKGETCGSTTSSDKTTALQKPNEFIDDILKNVPSFMASLPAMRRPTPCRCAQRRGGSRRLAGPMRTFYLQKARWVPTDARG